MTLSELDNSLPNGLHDAYLSDMTFHFESGTASLKVKLLVSAEGQKTRHEDAEIRLSGLAAVVVEAPERAIEKPHQLSFSSFDTSERRFVELSRYPEEIQSLFHSLYLESPWNGFVHIAAVSAEVIWGAEYPD